jgi:hypothetical protein
MDSLSNKPTAGDIKLALRDLSRGAAGLDRVYDEAVKRINSQEDGYRELAHRILSSYGYRAPAWLSDSKRNEVFRCGLYPRS